MISQVLFYFVQIALGLNPSTLPGALTIGSEPLEIEFGSADDVSRGTPIVLLGKQIGSVTDVSEARLKTKAGVLVRAEISPGHRSMLRAGTVALITSPLPWPGNARQAVVELLVPSSGGSELVPDGERLPGFATFKELWAVAELEGLL